jgi:hypothetical protein
MALPTFRDENARYCAKFLETEVIASKRALKQPQRAFFCWRKKEQPRAAPPVVMLRALECHPGQRKMGYG